MPADHQFNRVLAALMDGDQMPWDDQLELVELPARHELRLRGDSTPHVHFPTSALLALTQTSASGGESPVALVGNDGVVGVAALMGTSPEASEAVVLHPGLAWRLPTSALDTDEPGSTRVLQAAVGYMLSLTSQVSQTAFCQRHHSVEQRLSRWLLTALDRLPGDELAMDLGELAPLLDVPASALAGAAAQLVGTGALACEPGRMVLLSRASLQAQACGCHAPGPGSIQWASQQR